MIDYTERIPNNVDLASDKTLQRALEKWQPAFLNWWTDAGPADSSALEVYLRTAISVEKDGWANFGYVRMPEYRWGIFLVPRDENRSVPFGKSSSGMPRHRKYAFTLAGRTGVACSHSRLAPETSPLVVRGLTGFGNTIAGRGC